MKQFVFLVVLGTLVLSACAPATPEPAPTMGIADIQATSVSMVWTMVAETQAAMPTDTPVPTATPLPPPTETPLPSPTGDSLLVFNTPTTAPSGSTGGDPCNKPLKSWIGQSSKLAIVNLLPGGSTNYVTLAIQSNRGGECGYIAFGNIGKGTVVQIPELSCFSVAVSATGKKNKNYNFWRGGLCTNNTDKYTLEIRENGLKFIGP